MKTAEQIVLAPHEVYEYAFSSVPAGKRRPVTRLMLILVGFTLSTSGITVGIRIGQSLPFWSALGVCLAGNLVLFFIASFWGALGQYTGNTSAHLVKDILGRKTSVLFSAFVVLAIIIWLGMNGEWLASIFVELFPGWVLPIPVTTVMVIAAGACASLHGWRGMEISSRIMVPLIILSAAYIFGQMAGFGMNFTTRYQPQNHLTFSAAFTLVAGNYMMSATTMPDVCRFSKSRRSTFCCASIYALTLLICNFCGILIAQLTEAHSLTYSVYLLKTTVMALLCLSMCTFTTQNVNVYVGSLALQNVLKGTMLGAIFPTKWRCCI